MGAMRGVATACVSLLLVIGNAGSAASDGACRESPAQALAADDAVPGELVVTFKAGVPAERAREISAALGVAVLRTMLGGRVQHVRAAAGASVAQLRQQYLSHPEVVAAEPNYKIRQP